MNPTVVATIVFACTFGGALLGIFIRAKLPDHHRDSDSKDVVKLVMGLIATMSALVLGLLISSTHSAYDAQDAEVKQLGVHLFQLDRILAHIGPDAADARDTLRQIVSADVARTWSKAGIGAATQDVLQAQRGSEELFARIATLPTKTDLQRFGQSRALQLLTTMGDTRRLLDEQARGDIAWPFLVVLVFWLTVLFVGFGLFARFNTTVIAALFVGALSVAGAIFLILEMNRPYTGLMQISSAPIRNALTQMGK